MPKQRIRPEPFYLVVLDRDKQVFNVVGLIEDDTPYVRAANKLQDQGRNVQVHNPGEYDSRQAVIDAVTEEIGFVYSPDPIFPAGSA